MPEPAVAERDAWSDLQAVLDQELSRLPEKYRTVIVLCDLEGKTGKEASRQLDLPQGTIASRLARARVMLAKRLARHGLAVSGGALAGALSQKAASAGVPTSVVSATIKAVTLVAAGQAAAAGTISFKVVALTEGVLRAMLLTKVKGVVAGLVLVTALVSGAGVIYQTQAAETPGSKRADQPVSPTKDESVKRPDAKAEGTKNEEAEQPAAKADDQAALQGAWEVVSIERDGKEQKWGKGPEPWQKKETWIVKNHWIGSNTGSLWYEWKSLE